MPRACLTRPKLYFLDMSVQAETSLPEGSLEPTKARLTLPLYALAIPAALQLIDRIADQLQLSQLLTRLASIWRELTHAFWEGLIDIFRAFLALPSISPTQMDVLSLGAILILMGLTRLLQKKFSLFGSVRPWDVNLSGFQVFLATISMLVFAIVFVLPAVLDHGRAIVVIALVEPEGDAKVRLLAYGASRIVLLLAPVALCSLAARADIARMHGDNERIRQFGTWDWSFVCYAGVGLVLASTEYMSLDGAFLYGYLAAVFWGIGFILICRHSPLSLLAVVTVAVSIIIADRVALLLAPPLTEVFDSLMAFAPQE